MIIDENRNLFYNSQNTIMQWPSPGNPVANEIDLFRGALGAEKAISITYESWKTQPLQKKFDITDMPTARASLIQKFPLGIITWVSHHHYFQLRPGNIVDPVSKFDDTRFLLVYNGTRVFEQLGFSLERKQFYFRTEGGERLELWILDPNGISLDQDEFFYLDVEIMLEPQHYLLSKEAGDLTSLEKFNKIAKIN